MNMQCGSKRNTTELSWNAGGIDVKDVNMLVLFYHYVKLVSVNTCTKHVFVRRWWQKYSEIRIFISNIICEQPWQFHISYNAVCFCLFCRCTNELHELNIQSRTGMLGFIVL